MGEKRIVHFIQTLFFDIIVDRLGDIQQTIDLQLFEVQFLFKRLDACYSLSYVWKTWHSVSGIV